MIRAPVSCRACVWQCRHTLECLGESKADTAHIGTARFDWSERRDLNSGPLAPHAFTSCARMRLLEMKQERKCLNFWSLCNIKPKHCLPPYFI